MINCDRFEKKNKMNESLSQSCLFRTKWLDNLPIINPFFFSNQIFFRNEKINLFYNDNESELHKIRHILYLKIIE